MKKSSFSVNKQVLCALFTTLIAVGAFIQIPVPYMDYFTLQFFFVLMAGILLGGKLGAVSVGCYVLLGLIGVPVFAAGGGIGYVLRPSFGYLIGFIAAAFVTGTVSRKMSVSVFHYFISCLAGFFVTYVIGMVYKYLILKYYLNTPQTLWVILLSCFPLDMPGDLILCWLASLTASRLTSFRVLDDVAKKDLIRTLKEKVLAGGQITKEEAMALYNTSEAEKDRLYKSADEIRKHFCSDSFDICTIINGKSGRCSENCKFCSQSAHYHTSSEQYPLLPTDEIVKQAKYNADRGVLRYSIVTSGRALSDDEVDRVCESVREIKKNADIEVCGSFGLLTKEQYSRLKHAGVTRIHNNLEASARFFPSVCTTHTHEDKIQAIKNAREAGMSICSGGIMGLGESVEDRIDMALELRELNVKSVPVNMLNPIPGTPFENNKRLTVDDMCRIVAVYRFILPDASIRLAGGRGLLTGHGRECFVSGANAVISGDMLTTSGYTIESDMKMIHELGYKPELWNK